MKPSNRTPSHPSVQLRSVHKRFGPIEALAGADLTAWAGEIHSLLGENGAGKTTLMSVLHGAVAPDDGEIVLEDAPVTLRTPRDAMAAGIGMVHQHFTLVPNLSVVENVALGVRAHGGGFRLPLDRVRARIAELEAVTGIPVDPDALVDALAVGARQRVEILKLLYRDPKILILDEPTAVLAPQEIEWLFGVLRALAGQGRTVLLIAHKLDEILGIADRVTVLRRGRTVMSAKRSDVDGAGLARAMIGRAPADPVRVESREPGERVARIDGAVAMGPRGETALDDVSLDVRRGEIIGIGGVEGNGQRELALLLAGRLRPTAGRVDLPPTTSLVPQDRGTDGLIPSFDLAENIALAFHDVPSYRRGPVLDWAAVRATAREVISHHAVETPSWRLPAAALSGGNQQKLVVGRALARQPDLLVAENPTRGLDIAATEFVRSELTRLKALPTTPHDGAPAPGETSSLHRMAPGIVFFSTDLDEVLELSDRIFVMVRGRLVAVPPDARTPAGLGRLMLGGDIRHS